MPQPPPQPRWTGQIGFFDLHTNEEKVQKEDHGCGNVQGLGDGGGGDLGRHHPHLAGGGPTAGAEGQLESGWHRCSYG